MAAAAAEEVRRHEKRTLEARAEERAVRETLAQTRAQITNAAERLAHRSAAGAAPADLADGIGGGLEVDVALRLEQLEAARALLRKVASDVRSLETEVLQFELPEGFIGVRGKLSEEQLKELLRRSYEVRAGCVGVAWGGRRAGAVTRTERGTAGPQGTHPHQPTNRNANRNAAPSAVSLTVSLSVVRTAFQRHRRRRRRRRRSGSSRRSAPRWS